MAVSPLSGGVPPPQAPAGEPGCGTVLRILYPIEFSWQVNRPVDPGRSLKHRVTRHPVSAAADRKSRQIGLFTNPVEHNSE
jgi:hypothetical protein